MDREEKEQRLQKRRLYDRIKYQENKEKEKIRKQKFYQENTKKVRDRNKRYRENNPEKVREYARNYAAKRRENIQYRIQSSIRCRIWRCIKKRSEHSMDLTGCTLEFLINYLESKFEEGMSWENYGNPNKDHTDCWHIDHIRPCCSFDMTDKEQQRQCFHYTNLQPMWGLENISKGGRHIVSITDSPEVHKYTNE